MKKFKKIPNFKNKNDEKNFWRKNDSTEFVDWSKANKSVEFPNLKPSTKTISLRMTESMLNNLKMLANKNDIPYQSFIKMILTERIEKNNSVSNSMSLNQTLHKANKSKKLDKISSK